MLLDLLPLFDEAVTTGGGTRRRNQGKGGPGQARRTVHARWAYHATITAEPAHATHITPAPAQLLHATPAATITRTITVNATGHTATRTSVTPPPVRLSEDEDELLLLDLL